MIGALLKAKALYINKFYHLYSIVVSIMKIHKFGQHASQYVKAYSCSRQ